MKPNIVRLFFLLLPLFLHTACSTPTPKVGSSSYKGIVAGINAPQSLQIMGEAYEVGYSATGADQAIVEYFRAGETAKSWTRMLGMHLYLSDRNSFEMVKAMEQEFRAKGLNSMKVFKGPDDNGHCVDFILPGKGYHELNVWRYVDRPDGHGTTAFQYAEIIPYATFATMDKSQITNYLKDRRAKAVKAMESAPMPTIDKVPSP